MVLKTIYKTVRSILFTVTLLVVGIYVVAYVLLSIPSFTNMVKERAARELTGLLGGKVTIGTLSVFPFNEVTLKEVALYDPDGEKCLSIETVGAGIRLWRLITEGKIEITYGEIIGLDVLLAQKDGDGPLNIQFLIDALTSKDENKEKKKFELALKNVVLRKSRAIFNRPWMYGKKFGEFDISSIIVNDMAADISFPKISDNGIEIDLRRLSFSISDALTVEKLAFKGDVGKDKIYLQNIILELSRSRIYVPEVNLESREGETLTDILAGGYHRLEIADSYLTPSEFSFLFDPLSQFTEPLPLIIDMTGNTNDLSIGKFQFGDPDLVKLTLNGTVTGLDNIKTAKGEIKDLNLSVNGDVFRRLSPVFEKLPEGMVNAIDKLGNVEMTGSFSGLLDLKLAKGEAKLNSQAFSLSVEGEFSREKDRGVTFQGEANIEDFHVSELVPKIPIENFSASIVGEGRVYENKMNGSVNLELDEIDYKGIKYDGVSLNLRKEGEDIEGELLMQNVLAYLEVNFRGDLEGEEKSAEIELDLQELNLSEIIDMKDYKNFLLGGNLSLNAQGRNIDDVTGNLTLSDLKFTSPEGQRDISLNRLNLNIEEGDNGRAINLKSDWVDGRVEGNFKLTQLANQMKNLLGQVFPVFINYGPYTQEFVSDLDFEIVFKTNNNLTAFFNLPVRMLSPLTIGGSIDGSQNSASLAVGLPYLQQGKDKLIYDTRLVADIDGNSGFMNALLETTVPVKKGDLSLNVDLFGYRNTLTTDIHWVNTENSDFKGHLVLDTEFGKNEMTAKPEIMMEIHPSVLRMGTADWDISRSLITYSDNILDIDGLRISHKDQFIEINGTASSEYADVVKVSLADIDVDYVFDMLSINYVTFGGSATGEISGHALLSGDPVAETESFVIKDFSYNGSRLGTCVATSAWNNAEKEVEITADIRQNNRQIVYGSGGIWLGLDSLCFDIRARKVPVEFVQPFMAVFSSHVGGFATGDVRLFGNFHDIDMTGKIFADSVAVKLDYTNTVYHGSDSIFLNPGQIDIPGFRLYDKNGNSALLTGELKHRYFHDPTFTFRLSDASNFLCYDTSSEINPDWYGTLFGSGSALIKGIPGLVDISADMTVSGNSDFTFVLNETEYARDYEFLTFSDKRGEMKRLSDTPTVEDIKELFRRRMKQEDRGLSLFGIDIRATVTPQVLFTLVMDPAAGDKITARGKGAMQVKYESDDDEMMMYGKYEIEEGNYNFSLQDIILRDFKIKEGSYISFNGNPLAADLDISASYRVNTNLSDLDKSFSTDRDLNRTNVPVDAVLSVSGNMQQPDITFDIELPTLTQDVERKVKSIISTDDMMNRQIIYLLALNRFYTPEYMGATGNGGELAAVASSTISSQLTNMLGQLTDKFSVSPSFRSDKGDFSDIEVDVALSSRLLNNRLLINGNFGYRDRSTSTTTFVGDFDVEYLLSKNGNLRLKAYNHFNDQNYYLREALTTQGLGLIYRKDFDNWFTFLKKRPKIVENVKLEEENKTENAKEQLSSADDEEIKDKGNGSQD